MRIGNRLGGAVFWAMVALISASWAVGADGVERVQPVPLGGSLAEQTGDRHFGVYIPTRFGGELTIKATSARSARSSAPTVKNVRMARRSA